VFTARNIHFSLPGVHSPRFISYAGEGLRENHGWRKGRGRQESFNCCRLGFGLLFGDFRRLQGLKRRQRRAAQVGKTGELRLGIVARPARQ